MARHDPRAEDPESNEPLSVDKIAINKSTPTAPASDPSIRPQAQKVVTSVDPRLAEVEKLLVQNDWQAAAAKLGTEDVGKLPPNLALVVAIAQNEAAKDGSQEARELAVRCTAALLGMPEDSEIVRILVRRLLRKNPVRLAQRPAPPAKVSFFIILLTLALGGGVGWLLTTGTIERLLRH